MDEPLANVLGAVASVVFILVMLVLMFIVLFSLQEPHGNGPLFVEMHFYMRNGKLADSKSNGDVTIP